MGFDQGPSIGVVPRFQKGAKAPSLSVEHIGEIADLSSAYLNCEAAEFSEDELVSNLALLAVVAKRVKHSMAKKDVERINSLAFAVFGSAVAAKK
jgi:hypothetical protein